MRDRKLAAVSLIAIMFFCLPVFGQDQPKKRIQTGSTLDGASGLFKTVDAESLRQGDFNLSFGYDYFNRDPGKLNFQLLPVAFGIGLFDRIELFGVADVNKKVKESGLQVYRLVPGELPRLATNLSGATAANSDAPFMDVPNSDGFGDVRFGVKINALSERRGAPLGFSVLSFMKVPTHDSAVWLNRGLGTGTISGGAALLFSKRGGNKAQLHLNTGFNFQAAPEVNSVRLGKLPNEFIYRAGAGFPATGKWQVIAELDGKIYFGSKSAGLNPRSPADLIVGMRAYPKEWISLGAGYRATFNTLEENTVNGVLGISPHGYVAQLAFMHRKNGPPTVTCTVQPASIKQDETATVRCSAVDPDGDPLTYAWTTSGGKLTGSGDTVTFDATGIAPGDYTITANVSDDHNHTASASTKITVIKKNLPPTITCETPSVSIVAGESATLRVRASDPNNDPLTYSWKVGSETLAATGPTITFGSAGRQPGTYQVACTVSDGEFTASCTSTVIVREKPNQPPTIQCLTTTLDVASGGSVELRAQGSDPDNDRLTYAWTTTGGSVAGAGENATFNAAGLRAGSYTVTATVDDGRGGKASCTMTVNVGERITLSGFRTGSARLDNVMKAALDDIAVRMQNDTRLRANIIGYTDNTRGETRAKGLGLKRAQAAAKYLEGKGIDASRLMTTDGDANNPIGDNKTQDGRKQNRRIEIELSVR
jgi:outer membrane protein OmpA-like peptidoglycan-associated protein